jgi:hypothetical protein
MGIGAAAVGGIALTARASSGPASAASSAGALVFDPDAFTELTTTVTGTDGTAHSVTYRFWKALTYVAEPVDGKHQSLNVSVPVESDGRAVDASGAPILFANPVGGCLPSSVADATGVGAAGAPGARAQEPVRRARHPRPPLPLRPPARAATPTAPAAP